MKKREVFLLQFLIILSFGLKAGDETRSARIYANKVGPWAFVQSHDDKFTGSGGWISGFSIYSNRAVVELGLAEDKHRFLTTAMKICAKFDVQVTDANLNTQTYTNVQLDVNYDPAELTRYRDKIQIVFSPAYKVKVYNISITQCPLNNTCAQCTTAYNGAGVYLQTEVYSEKIYNFTSTSTFASGDVSHVMNGTTQQMDISWNYVPGAEEYELEYTYIDSYTGTFGTYLPASGVSYDLDHDATRIVTNYNKYSIPLTYETGFLVYRIRPVGFSSTKQRTEGTWFGAPASGLVSGAGSFMNSVSALQSDVANWEGLKTFSEHGRTGTGVKFEDASGHTRQVLSRLNTDQKTIVQSTLLDYYGRPTISILPAPVSGTNFNYRNGLNKYLSANFDKSIFGLCTGGTGLCSTSMFQLDVTAGASNYYSSSNPDQQGYQGYLPNAGGLPYIQVKYLPDPRNRITHRTLPGTAHALGSGKEVRFFFTQPTQVELDRLFGGEAGRAKYYNKNISIDPNGQVGATYIDMYGRTVATSLLGKKPLAVDALPNITGTLVLTEDLALAPTNLSNPVDRCKEVNVNFFVSAAGTEGYIYHTTLGSFVSPCDALSCYNCVYDVEISIKDDCGTEIFDHDTNNQTPPGVNMQIGQAAPYVPITCGTGATGIQIAGANLSTPVTVTFPRAGVYTVRKKICVSDAPIADYTNNFITNACNSKVCMLVDSIISETDFSGCETPTTNCAQCMADLQAYMAAAASSPTMITGTAPNTVVIQTPSMTPQQLSEAMENCKKLCPPTSKCDKMSQLFLADFTPGTGQYAALNNTDPTWAYSIFNPANSLFGTPTFSTPPTPYLNANGSADYVLLPNAVNAVAPSALSQADFVTYFKPSWAKSFLTVHPEYCKLSFQCDVLGPIDDWNDAMEDITHFDTACAAGYLIPFLPSTGAYSNFSVQVCSSSNPDPIVGLAITYPGCAAAISSFTNELVSNFNGSGFDIYRYVIAQSIPSASNVITGNYVGDDACREDVDWQLFKSFYQAKRFGLIQNLLSLYNTNPLTFNYNGPRCGYVPAPLTEHYPNVTEAINHLVPANPPASQVIGPILNGPNTFNTQQQVTNYSNALASFTANIVSNLNSTLSSQCATSCDSYTIYWNNTLNTGCPAYSSASQSVKNNILAGLRGVCMAGCDYNTNLMGASTTSPSTYFTLPSTNVNVTSFQQVLDYYLGTNACNAVLISQPAPYPGPGVPSTTSLTSCKCDLLLQVEADFATMTPTPNITSAWQLFRKQYGFDLVDYNILRCVCMKATNNNWVPGYAWTNSDLTALAQYTVPVNPKIKCYTCLSCNDVVNAINGMTLPSLISYPDPITAITVDSTNHIFAMNYLNNLLGPHPFQDYLDLYADCGSFNANGTFVNTITGEAKELFHYMNQLVTDNLINKGSTRPAKLCTDSKYFLSSLFAGQLPFPVGASYNYNVTTSGQDLEFTITNNVNTVLLDVKLKGPGFGPTTWNTLISLSNLVAWCPSPVSGANYNFKVDAMDNTFATYVLTGTVVTTAFPISYLSSGSPKPVLCPKKPKNGNTCKTTLLNNALTQAKQLASYYTEAQIIAFQNAYKDQCFNSLNETFKRSYNGADEYNYTLYYYDDAGNLHRTVPPNGVDVGLLSAQVTPLPLNSTTFPAYSNATNGVNLKYVSESRFNSYNQVVKQKNVDAGEMNFWYDPLGRLQASQDSKQTAMSSTGNNYYTYILYDAMGRMIESGQVKLSAVLSSSPVTHAAFTTLVGAAGTANRKQVTRIYYDEPTTISAALAVFSGATQKFLRNRVSFTSYIENYSPQVYDYDHATFYSYDDQGNVQEMVNHTKQLDVFPGAAYKKVQYEYELASGNMVRSYFQKGQPDQFIHKYYYDDDNRLHEVFTSKDDLNWDRDAKYFYYQHGPVARVERADRKVQATDYFYTIHGWIKGMNSNALTRDADPGKDGQSSNNYLSAYTDLHKWIATDAMSYDLNFYNVTSTKDYTPIKGFTSTDLNPIMSLANLYSNAAPFFLDDPGSLGSGQGASLYNGQISSMVTSIIDKDPATTIANNTPFPVLMGYRYDQLYRLTKSRAYFKYTGNTWDAPVSGSYYDTYKMDISYDFNGNIKSLFRNGVNSTLISGANYSMDDLTYAYKTVANGASVNSNQLYGLKDLGTPSNYAEDIEAPSTSIPSYNVSTNRFNYDALGNIISDKQEQIALIEWTNDCKVRRITRDPALLASAGVTKSDIEYEYNSSRQRVVKIVKPRDPSTKALKTSQYWIYTYYSYDATGNVAAVYERNVVPWGANFKNLLALSEHHVYGRRLLAISRASDTLAKWYYNFYLNGPCSTPEIPCDFVMLPPDDVPPMSGARGLPPGSGGVGLPTYTPQTFDKRSHMGYKEFQLENHLGNVITTVSDRKINQYGDQILNNQFNGASLDGWNPNPGTTNSFGQLAYTTNQQYSAMERYITTVPGRTYRVRFNLSMPGSPYIIQAEVYPVPVVAPFLMNVSTVFGANEFVFTATTNQSLIRIQRADNLTNTSIIYYIDNVIVDQLTNYGPDILMNKDYYPGGQEMPARKWIASNYRYSHNGQEREDEIYAGAQSADFWMYDSRLIRRWNTDFVVKPWESPYACFKGNPIYYADPSGLDGDPPVAKEGDAKGEKGSKAPNGGVRNGEGGVIGGEPVCLTCGKNGENTYGIPKDEEQPPAETTPPPPRLPAPSTGNGPSSGQPLPDAPPDAPDAPPGNYYEGWWEVSYNPNLRAVSNFNTANIANMRPLSEPNFAQYMEQARNLAHTGGFSASAGGIEVNSDGEVALELGHVGATFGEDGVTDVSVFGASVGPKGVEVGPITATRETEVYTPGPYICHAPNGAVTGTVQATFIITNIKAAVFVGGFKSTVTAVRSFTPVVGTPSTQVLGTSTTKGVSISGDVGEIFSGSIDFSVMQR